MELEDGGAVNNIKLSVQGVEGILILSVAGEVDVYNSKRISKAVKDLHAAGKGVNIVLELSQVPHVDSSGLSVFIESFQFLKKQGGRLKFAALSKPVAHIFNLTNLYTHLEIFDTIEEAARSYKEQAAAKK